MSGPSRENKLSNANRCSNCGNDSNDVPTECTQYGHCVPVKESEWQTGKELYEETVRLKEANRRLAAGLNKYSRHLYHDCLYRYVYEIPEGAISVDQCGGHWEHRGAIKECHCGLAQLLLEATQ
jgi:hypothetical protein